MRKNRGAAAVSSGGGARRRRASALSSHHAIVVSQGPPIWRASLGILQGTRIIALILCLSSIALNVPARHIAGRRRRRALARLLICMCIRMARRSWRGARRAAACHTRRKHALKLGVYANSRAAREQASRRRRKAKSRNRRMPVSEGNNRS